MLASLLPTIALLFSIFFLSSTATARCLSEGGGCFDPDGMLQRYQDWQTKYGKVYGDRDEWEMRFGIYQSNVQLVEFVNSQNLSYKLGDNKYADMTNAEFRSIYLGYKHPNNSDDTMFSSAELEDVVMDTVSLPFEVDWRRKSAVTMKDQWCVWLEWILRVRTLIWDFESLDFVSLDLLKPCLVGGCWAFSAIAAVEGINQIKTGRLVSLSEQELLDCDHSTINQGCQGGLMNKAFQFIERNGVTRERDYPFAGENGRCSRVREREDPVRINGYVKVPRNDERALLAAVARQPISVAMDARGSPFQLYSHRVFTGQCGDRLDHGVTVIGYGEEDGEKYWIVKNSWGASWGEAGYFKPPRGTGIINGKCGIHIEPSYPIKGDH